MDSSFLFGLRSEPYKTLKEPYSALDATIIGLERALRTLRSGREFIFARKYDASFLEERLKFQKEDPKTPRATIKETE